MKGKGNSFQGQRHKNTQEHHDATASHCESCEDSGFVSGGVYVIAGNFFIWDVDASLRDEEHSEMNMQAPYEVFIR